MDSSSSDTDRRCRDAPATWNGCSLLSSVVVIIAAVDDEYAQPLTTFPACFCVIKTPYQAAAYAAIPWHRRRHCPSSLQQKSLDHSAFWWHTYIYIYFTLPRPASRSLFASTLWWHFTAIPLVIDMWCESSCSRLFDCNFQFENLNLNWTVLQLQESPSEVWTYRRVKRAEDAEIQWQTQQLAYAVHWKCDNYAIKHIQGTVPCIQGADTNHDFFNAGTTRPVNACGYLCHQLSYSWPLFAWHGLSADATMRLWPAENLHSNGIESFILFYTIWHIFDWSVTVDWQWDAILLGMRPHSNHLELGFNWNIVNSEDAISKFMD